MKEIARRNAGLLAALLGIIIVLLVYTLLGTVDLVFMKGDLQVARMEDVRVISDLQLDAEDVLTGEELEFTYGEGKTYAADMNLRFEIAKTLVVNLFTQKWDNADQVIIFESK
jgi:hypothetical protein